MRRRAFITLLGAAAAWPLAARAQREQVRRIGVLASLPSDNPEGMARLTAFVQSLQQLGWTDGQNVRIDYRWAAGDAERIRRYAVELVALAPDVILSPGTLITAALLQATRTIPIVFAQTTDPGRSRLGRKLGATGRQRHRLYRVRIRHKREVVGTTQRDHTRHNARGSHS
jgi:putative tryptophan/tyrosine transport system substrate-binding protein